MHSLLANYRWSYCLLAAAMLAAQGFAQVHATEHGDHEHSHDGHPCVVAFYSDRLEHDVPLACAPTLHVANAPHNETGTAVPHGTAIEAVASRPRAPPFLT